MNEQQGFLDAIKQNPRDFVTRKIYADWLDEHDFPEEAQKQRNWNDEKQDAYEWIGNFGRIIGSDTDYYDESDYKRENISADRLIELAIDRLDGGSDAIYLSFETPEESYTMNTEFWQKIKIITGRDIEDDHYDNFVRCGC